MHENTSSILGDGHLGEEIFQEQEKDQNFYSL